MQEVRKNYVLTTGTGSRKIACVCCVAMGLTSG